MAEVEFKIHELREAANQFKKTSQRMDQSMQLVRGLIEPILPELKNPEGVLFAQNYHSQRVFIEYWMENLTKFAIRLAQAGDDLEEALYGVSSGKDATPPPMTPTEGGVPFVLPSLGALYRSTVAQNTAANLPRPEMEITQRAVTPPVIEEKPYLSAVNSPIYDEMLHNERKLTEQKAQLNTLQQHRDDLAEDLTALENRLMSYDNMTNPDSIPRVQALKTEISAINGQIDQLNSDIQQTDSEISKINVRLERVTPGKDADLLVIAALEQGETPEIIRQNTEGCVNYIVNRMPIPVNIPRDAHLWDNLAAQFDQYGIKMGDTPLVGSVIVFETDHSYADEIAGHLMYVEKVENGHIWITDNNHTVPVLLSELTDELTGPNIKFLYFPWHTQA